MHHLRVGQGLEVRRKALGHAGGHDSSGVGLVGEDEASGHTHVDVDLRCPTQERVSPHDPDHGERSSPEEEVASHPEPEPGVDHGVP